MNSNSIFFCLGDQEELTATQAQSEYLNNDSDGVSNMFLFI